MGVPSETTDGGRSLSALSRRPIAATLTLIAVSMLAYLYAPMPAPNVRPATAGDCVELHALLERLSQRHRRACEHLPGKPSAAAHVSRRAEFSDRLGRSGVLLFGRDRSLARARRAHPAERERLSHRLQCRASRAAYLRPNDDTAVARVARRRAAASLRSSIASWCSMHRAIPFAPAMAKSSAARPSCARAARSICFKSATNGWPGRSAPPASM
jgi:hypothetical protein